MEKTGQKFMHSLYLGIHSYVLLGWVSANGEWEEAFGVTSFNNKIRVPNYQLVMIILLVTECLERQAVHNFHIKASSSSAI